MTSLKQWELLYKMRPDHPQWTLQAQRGRQGWLYNWVSGNGLISGFWKAPILTLIAGNQKFSFISSQITCWLPVTGFEGLYAWARCRSTSLTGRFWMVQDTCAYVLLWHQHHPQIPECHIKTHPMSHFHKFFCLKQCQLSESGFYHS